MGGGGRGGTATGVEEPQIVKPMRTTEASERQVKVCCAAINALTGPAVPEYRLEPIWSQS